MTTAAYSLGRDFDIASVIPVANLSAGASTGTRVSMKNAEVCTFVVFVGAGTDGDDLAVDLREHTAATGGTSQDLDAITKYYTKNETTLDGDEAWVEVSQTAASEITPVAATAEVQNLWVIEVLASELSAGFPYVSLDIPDLGSAGTKYGGVIAILSRLRRQGAPADLSTQ